MSRSSNSSERVIQRLLTIIKEALPERPSNITSRFRPFFYCKERGKPTTNESLTQLRTSKAVVASTMRIQRNLLFVLATVLIPVWAVFQVSSSAASLHQFDSTTRLTQKLRGVKMLPAKNQYRRRTPPKSKLIGICLFGSLSMVKPKRFTLRSLELHFLIQILLLYPQSQEGVAVDILATLDA